MKYRTKLYLFFIALVFCTTFLSLGLIYWKAKKMIGNELRSKVLTVVSTGAPFIDGDLIASLNTKEDAKTPAYRELFRQVEKIQNANRRPDLYVLYAYIIRPSPANPKEMEAVVDVTIQHAERAYPGTLYPEGAKIGILDHLMEVWAPPHLIRDRWGQFLSGYAPIYDGSGKYVATLGIDLSARYVVDQLGSLRLLIFSTLMITLLIGFIAATFLSHIVTRSLARICQGVDEIGHGHLETRIAVDAEDEFGHLAHMINGMAKGLEERERLKLNFIRYVSKHVMDKILSTDRTPTLKGERKKITVLFSDIREFTRLAEKLPPEEVVSLLNEYLDEMLNVIFSNNGTLDKFMGDGLMVEFGAPLDDADQEKNGVKTALEMQAALNALSRKWAKEGRPQLQMGIGIHTGLAVVGNIGSEKRMEYTAIGDTVNVASRLEQATKDFHASILVSETTARELGGAYSLKDLGLINLPGRDQPIRVFSVEINE